MNIGEGRGRYCVTPGTLFDEVQKGLVATLKLDGTLLVRFVQNSKVRFRTRGTLSMKMENAHELGQFFNDHPILVDPTYHPGDSILFEWVSPENQIVIKYGKPAIHLIGGVTCFKERPWWDARITLYPLAEVEKVSEEMGIQMVDNFPLNRKSSVEDLIALLDTDKEIEGFVLRFNDGQEMVKLKTEHYFILHALKSKLTTSKLVELWLSWNKPSYEAFEEKFTATYDWETWQWAMPVVSAMFDGVRNAKSIINHVGAFVGLNGELDRKSFALLSQERFNQLRLSLCFILLDKKMIPAKIWQKLILQNCKQMEKTIGDD